MSAEMEMSPWRRAWLYVVVAIILAFLIVPILIVIPMSFSGTDYLQFPPATWSLRWYRTFFGSLEWREATIMSLKAAVLTTLVATPVGLLAAYSLATSTSPAMKLIRSLILVPAVVPVILVAIGLYYAYAQLGLVGSLTGLVLAHALIAVPYVTITLMARFQRFDFTQEMVARSLGASRPRAFWMVTLPQIRPALVASALFAFITSFDEVVIALLLTGGEHSTLTRRMFSSLRDEIDPTIAAISTLLIVLSAFILTAAQMLPTKGEGTTR